MQAHRIGGTGEALPSTFAGATNAELRDMLEHLRRAHSAALAHIGDLEKRIRGREAALDAVQRDLESFTYSVSHDLRAPLRAIGGFTDILLRDHASRIPPDAAPLFERVIANVKRMNALIDELVEFSRAGQRALVVQPVNVARLVAECVAELSADAPEGGARFVIGDLPSCRADLQLLKQAIVNLLSNALKFSSTRDPARIEVAAELRADEYLWHVSDNGVGFDMRMAHKLFQVFQRLHAQSEYAGSGMGLAVVRRIIERHGGRVWAQGAPDQGATFHFSLPAGGPPQSADA